MIGIVIVTDSYLLCNSDPGYKRRGRSTVNNGSLITRTHDV
jgi:hypothetical protein